MGVCTLLIRRVSTQKQTSFSVRRFSLHVLMNGDVIDETMCVFEDIIHRTQDDVKRRKNGFCLHCFLFRPSRGSF